MWTSALQNFSSSALACPSPFCVVVCSQMCAQKFRTIKIGNKLVSLERARNLVERIFHLRSTGSTQQEVASLLGVERSFISHLEGLGEIRRSKQIALIGSSVKNRVQVEQEAKELGIDLVYLTDGERTRMGEILRIIAQVKGLDFVVFLGSDEEASLLERILDTRIVSIPLEKADYLKEIIGELAEKRTRRVFRSMKRGEKGEGGSKRKSWLLSSGPRGKS